MAFTNIELRALLLRKLHNDGTFSDPADLNTYLTLAQNQIVRESPHTLGIKRTTASLTSSNQQVLIASDVHKILAVFIPALSRRLEYIPQQRFIDEVELTNSVSEGAPMSYTMGNYDASVSQWYIRFDYIADATYTIAYWYYWMPEAISGSTTCAISGIGFSDLLLNAAVMHAREHNDPQGHGQAKAHYDEGMLKYKAYVPADPDWNVDQVPALATVRQPFGLDPAHFP